MKLTGSCLCGAIKFECDGEPLTAVFCHCRNCQKAHSAPYAAAVLMPPSSIRVLQSASLRRHETIADSGSAVFREFCGLCGTHLFSGGAAFPELKSIKIAALDDPNSVVPVVHVWTEQEIEWARVDDDSPRFHRQAEMSEIVDLWRTRS
jgi:hypothetical protein